MLPPPALSKVDNKGVAEDMRSITQPRGSGTGYVFRIKTPPALRGSLDPNTGKPFGTEIKRGLQTRHLPEARKRRDIWLGWVRELEANASSSGEQYSRWSTSAALELRQAITEQRKRGTGHPHDADYEVDLNSLAIDEIENELSKPPSRRSAPPELVKRYAGVALRGDLPIDEAVRRYVEARAPGNRQELKPLARTTVLSLHTSVEHLKRHIGGDPGIQSVDQEHAHTFRTEFLPSLKSPRAPNGLTQKTIDKHITLLRNLWAWAEEARCLGVDAPDIWAHRRRVPRSKSSTTKVKDFTADQVSKLLSASRRGTHKGDILRLLLVTGCRANDIASLTMTHVRDGCVAFTVDAGKTENASRFVPLIPEAQRLLDKRVAGKGAGDRVFPEWALRPNTGKPSALSQWFTRYRRQVLGDGTDNALKLHSFRHTWRTVARRARVRESDINDLGGWAGARTSDSTYDHGLLESQLTETQEAIGEMMREGGYLDDF